MFSKSNFFKSEYCCSIIRVGEVKPIDGKDKIGYTLVNGETIVVRKDQVKEGDVLFYASNETQLDKDFLGANNLFESSSYQLNSNANEIEPYVLKNKEMKERVEFLEKTIEKVNKFSNVVTTFEADMLACENDSERERVKVYYNNVCKRLVQYVGGGLNINSKSNDFIIEAEKFVAIKRAEIDTLKKEIENNTAFIRSHVGFFNKNGRVRSIRLGGVQSMGYLFSLDELAKYNPNVKDVNLSDLVGEDFDTIEDKLFIKAYVPFVPERRQASKVEKRNKKIEQFDRMVKGEFSFHYDTSPLPKCIGRLKPSDVVTITSKLHGCVEKHTIVNTMEYGDKTIGEIVDNKINCHIKAYDTDTNEIIYVPIDNFYTIPNDGEWYEIELENGKKITVTGNNPIWLPELGIYRRVDELNGDEKILFSDD